MEAVTLLRIVPPEVRPHLITVGSNKQPLARHWQQPRITFSDRQLLHAAAIGLRLGYCGILAVDFDPPAEDPAAGDRQFKEITGHDASELPATWAWSSGKPGRRQLGLMVPADQRQGLKPASHGALEFRWIGQQSVICGHHPETGAYRWLPGCSPAELALANAPDWLIGAIKPPPPVPYQPRARSGKGDRSPADWCRYYLEAWPNNDLNYWAGWWPTICVLHRAGVDREEARAWSASSSKHTDQEFDRQWDKAGRRDHGYGIEWLGAVTKANRAAKKEEIFVWTDQPGAVDGGADHG
jgi:hypothetical protein